MERPPIEDIQRREDEIKSQDWMAAGSEVAALLTYIRRLEGAIDMTVTDGNIGNLMEIWDQIPRES